MDDLDGDGKLLKSPINGQGASRDIVQFVPSRKFIGLSSGSSDFGMSNSRLGRFPKLKKKLKTLIIGQDRPAFIWLVNLKFENLDKPKKFFKRSLTSLKHGWWKEAYSPLGDHFNQSELFISK